MHRLHAEMDLLRAVLRQRLSDDATRDDIALRFSGVNWHHVLWLGRQCHALVLLQDVVKDSSLCPPEIVASLNGLRDMIQLRSLAHAREVCQVQNLFDRHEIPAIATGRWMASTYAIQPGLIEPESALRYLVPAADFDRANAALVEGGHPLVGDPEKLIRPGHSPVQLNSGLGKHPSASRFWRDTFTVSFGGRSHRRPSFIHWLLLRADHLRRRHMSLADAHEIVGMSRHIAANEWGELLDEAKHFDLCGVLPKIVDAAHAALSLPTTVSCDDSLFGETASASAATESGTVLPNVAAPFLPTPTSVVDRMLMLAGTGPNDVVCDLGCGDGRIAIKAAKHFGARGLGIDRNPERIAEARSNAIAQGVGDRVTFTCGDLFAVPLADATVVTCYLLPQLQPPLKEKLFREVRPGTRVISHEFIFPGWPPEKTEIIRVTPLKVCQIYLWLVG